jgi:hypothetical protein
MIGKVLLLIALCVMMLAAILRYAHAHEKHQVEGCGVIHFGSDVIDQTPPEQNRCSDRRTR